MSKSKAGKAPKIMTADEAYKRAEAAYEARDIVDRAVVNDMLSKISADIKAAVKKGMLGVDFDLGTYSEAQSTRKAETAAVITKLQELGYVAQREFGRPWTLQIRWLRNQHIVVPDAGVST